MTPGFTVKTMILPSLDFEVYPVPATSLFDTIQTHMPDTVILETNFNADYDYWWNGIPGSNIYNVQDAGWQYLTVTATRGNGCSAYDSTNVELLFYDVGAYELVHPVNNCGFGTLEYPVVRIRNFGTDSVKAGQKIAVAYTMNAGLPVSGYPAINQNPVCRENSEFYFFKGALLIYPRQVIYTFVVNTSYSGDTITSNDAITANVEILGRPVVSLGADITVEALSIPLMPAAVMSAISGITELLSKHVKLPKPELTGLQVFDANHCDNNDTAYIRLKIRDISPGGFASPVSDCSFNPAEPVSSKDIEFRYRHGACRHIGSG